MSSNWKHVLNCSTENNTEEVPEAEREKREMENQDDWFIKLRGCLSKNHPLNLAQKIILPETLPTERLYQG